MGGQRRPGSQGSQAPTVPGNQGPGFPHSLLAGTTRSSARGQAIERPVLCLAKVEEIQDWQ